MNDGGEAESKRKTENAPISSNTRKRAASGEYSRETSKTAVAQICESVGFEGFNESALESLTDIAVRHLCDLGKTAKCYANLAGRTDSNVFDIVQGLEDMGMCRGFSGASEVSHCTMSSGVLKEIVEYVETAEEIPFAQPVPHFPVVKDRSAIPSFLQMGEMPNFKHIPSWLPAFPDPHTYIQTPVWNERRSDPRADKLELARQRRKAERSLLSLQQRLLCNGSAIASTSAELEDGWTKSGEGTENPFLSMPLAAGEKDVSPVVLPAKISDEVDTKSHGSLLDTFAPAIEAMKDGLSDSGNGTENYLPEKRPVVSLEFKSGKKILGESLDLRLRNRNSGRIASSFRRDDEKDDKKRRAELILRQSMENQQELTQL